MIDHTQAGDESDPETPEPLHYVHDVLGSTTVLTDATGAAVERYTYDPYGKTVIENAPQTTVRARSSYGNPWAWTGQRYDAGVQLYHFLFRSYSPTLGRWMQRDPIGYVDGVNLFTYAMNMPTRERDPLGLEIQKDIVIHNGVVTANVYDVRWGWFFGWFQRSTTYPGTFTYREGDETAKWEVQRRIDLLMAMSAVNESANALAVGVFVGQVFFPGPDDILVGWLAVKGLRFVGSEINSTVLKRVLVKPR